MNIASTAAYGSPTSQRDYLNVPMRGSKSPPPLAIVKLSVSAAPPLDVRLIQHFPDLPRES